MGAFKDKKSGSWYVQFRYTDWQGKRQQKLKRGFATKHEALEWEREFLLQKQTDVTMSFGSFYELYKKDIKPRLKENTWQTKENIIEGKIIPYFKDRKLCDISATDVIEWQNEIRTLKNKHGKLYSKTYLRTVHNQLSAMFNHAVKHYDLRFNPAAKVGSMGDKDGANINFWTKDEYKRFAEEMMDKPVSYYAFEMLYWCGIREGELLALTAADFDFNNSTVRINKSYQRLHGEDVITTPKTKKSNRVIKMPQFLCEEMQDYFGTIYGLKKKDRIFPLTKSYLHHEMDRGAKAAGVKRIRIHDLRHSSCALLIHLGYSPIQIAERLGHESVTITERYAHLYPSVQRQMAVSLDDAFRGKEENDDETGKSEKQDLQDSDGRAEAQKEEKREKP